LDESVRGITRFCTHPPEWRKTKVNVGGTKKLKPDIIHRLQPDLIIANKEENTRDEIEGLAKHYPVWVSDVNTVPDALEMIKSVGEITNTVNKADALIQNIATGFTLFTERRYLFTRNALLKNHQPLTAYLIWQNPYMAAGGDTFIHAMISACGLNNVFSQTRRYPVITINDIRNANCELLLLSSEPFPFTSKHVEELQQQLPDTSILLVDGEIFSWYGSRLLHVPDYFESLWQKINAPDLHT
jgi:ABC-type Fe3+-hydroxamate transport system substrate-binding protein